MTCIFCQIAAHAKSSKIFYEDSDIIVFADIFPKAYVHLLISPKAHYTRIMDLPDDLTLKIFETVRKITKELGLENNFQLVLHNGAKAGQIVEHLHFHYMSNEHNVAVKYGTVIS
jgi:histidine triad (HIT) family protein